MVWFWQLHGRQMGGVFVLFAPPGEGKSYVATAIALELMIEGVKVFSNFPIVSVDGKYCSYVFEKSLMKENLSGCAIFIDEGYTIWNSRKFDSFTDEDHDWFATSGHNEMIIYVIAQNFTRIDKVIREVCNLIIEVRKNKIPILDLPLWFTANYWLDVDDYSASRYHEIDPYMREYFRFTVDVALAYDTKFFRKDTQPPYEGETWLEFYKGQGMEYKPIRFNLVQRLKYIYYNPLKERFINFFTPKQPFDPYEEDEKCTTLEEEQQKPVEGVHGLIGSMLKGLLSFLEKQRHRFGGGLNAIRGYIRQKFRL